MTPGLYQFSPPLLIFTDGKPSYGQIMLAEFIGSYIFISIVLVAKRNSASTKGEHAAAWILAIGVALTIVNEMLSDVSGGVVNPAIASALMIWQEFTISLDPINSVSLWTYEYATGYLIGPFVGAMLAGVIANTIQVQKDTMA